jgi:hypothetical protein
MYGSQIDLEFNAVFPAPSIAGEVSKWFAIRTVARHEKRVTQQLQENGVLTFLPLMQQVCQWSDRRAKDDSPRVHHIRNAVKYRRTYSFDRIEVSGSLTIIACAFVRGCVKGILRIILRYGTERAKLCTVYR